MSGRWNAQGWGGSQQNDPGGGRGRGRGRSNDGRGQPDEQTNWRGRGQARGGAWGAGRGLNVQTSWGSQDGATHQDNFGRSNYQGGFDSYGHPVGGGYQGPGGQSRRGSQASGSQSRRGSQTGQDLQSRCGSQSGPGIQSRRGSQVYQHDQGGRGGRGRRNERFRGVSGGHGGGAQRSSLHYPSSGPDEGHGTVSQEARDALSVNPDGRFSLNPDGCVGDSRYSIIRNLLDQPDHTKEAFSAALYPPDPPPIAGNQRVQTNHFLVKAVPTKLYAYSVRFETPVPDSVEHNGSDQASVADPTTSAVSRQGMRKSEKRQVFKKLRDHCPLNNATCPWTTDYESKIWSMNKFPCASDAIKIYDLQYPQQNGRPMKLPCVTLEEEQSLDLVSNDSTSITDNQQQAKTAALNAIVSHYVSERCSEVMHVVANKFYYRKGYRTMTGLHAFRGYFTSLRPGSQKLLLNVNTITTAFHQPLLVSQFLQLVNDPDVPRATAEYGREVYNLLKNVRVRITYSRSRGAGGAAGEEDADERNENDLDDEMNRRKTIMEFGSTPDRQGINPDGSKTVADYFHDMDINIRYMDLRCVNVGKLPPRNRTGQTAMGPNSVLGTHPGAVWIPPEFLEIDLAQPFRGAMGPAHVAQMIDVALRSPAANAKLIVSEGLRLLGVESQAHEFRDFGLQIDDRLLQIPATFMNEPTLQYKEAFNTTRHASWNLRSTKFYQTPAHEQGIHIVYLDRNSPASSARCDAILVLDSQLAKLGISTTTSTGFDGFSQNNRPADDHALTDALRNCNLDDLCLVVLDDNSKSGYARVKRVFDVQLGIHTVCVTSGKFLNNVSNCLSNRGDLRSRGSGFFANLGMKINLKFGGINHVVTNPGGQSLDEMCDGYVVLGADVVHPAQSAQLGVPSVAALVGSSGKDVTTFPGSMRLNPGGQEMIEDLRGMVLERLATFVNGTSTWPRGIFFYRDGVSESQYNDVRTKEIPQIDQAVEDLRSAPCATIFEHGEMPDIPLTMIIVTKRHHVRFYPMQENQSYKASDRAEMVNGNVKPGLLVTQDVTQPGENSDFFLQSHQALKGTARSAHYIVLENGLGKDLGFLAKVTHALCFNYARATRGVSYACPAYYADRLCDRGYHYLREWFDRDSTSFLPARQNGETDEAFKRRAAAEIQNHVSWNPRAGLPQDNAPPRINPWHENMDHVMFYL